MIRIDYDRCNGCGLCALECLSGVLLMENDRPVVARKEQCNLCSHCLSVCPRRAFVHERLGKKPGPRVKRKLLQAEAYQEIVRSRRSVRHFKPDPVPRELIESILDLARYSPTASNAQNVSYTVVRDQALLQQISRRIFEKGERIYRLYTQTPLQTLARSLKNRGPVKSLNRYAGNWAHYQKLTSLGRDLLFHHAPVLVLIHGPKGVGLAKENCLIAATNMDNYAHALGLGACFIGLLVAAMQVDRSLYHKFRIPENQKVHAALALGYPAHRHTCHVARKEPSVQWLDDSHS